MSNRIYLDSTDHVDDKAPNDNNDSYPPNSQERVRFSSPRPTLVETWLESVRSKCSSNSPQKDDLAGTSRDISRSRQTSYLQSADEPNKILQKTHTPVCSLGLFIPVSPSLQDNTDSVNRPMLGGPEHEFLQTGGSFRSENSRHCFSPPPRPKNHHLCEKFHRQPRRKTREDRYDTKHPMIEDQNGTDRPARPQDNRRMCRKRRLRSGKEIMMNFTSDVIKKENVTMRPHVAEGLLSEDRPLNNTTLADLAFHNFDLSLSKTKLSTFSAADIDSTSRRSNILPESDALSPMERANQQNTDDDCSKVNPKDFPSAPEQFPGVSKIGEIPKGKKEVHMESATSLIGTVPLTLDNQITQDSDDFVWQKNQPGPIVRATNDRQHKFYHSPSMNAPEQLELRQVSLQHVTDQDNHGILRPSIFDDGYIPQWHTSEVGRHTLRQPYKDDTAQYKHGMSPCDGFIADEPVTFRFQRPPRDPTSDVTVHQNSGVRSPILYQPPVTRGSVDLDQRSSRHLAYQDSQWGGGYDFAPLFRTISASPMSWADSVFPNIGQICCNPDSRTKTQFLMGQTPEFHGFGSSETVIDRGMLPHDSDGECSRDRAFDTFGLKRRRVPNEMGLLQNDESTCSWNPNNDLHDKRARYFDQDLHTVRSTEDLRFLNSIQDRKLNKHPDVESGRDFDILQQAKFGPSRQTIDAPGLVPIHESLYGSTFKLF